MIVAAVGVLGAVLLGIGVNAPPGGLVFFVCTLAVAALWVLGGVAAGRRRMFQRLGPNDAWRDIAWGLGVGGGLLVAFLLGAGVVAQIPPLTGPVDALLEHARWGSLAAVTLVTAISGITEEVYFRGALFDVIHFDTRLDTPERLDSESRLDTPPDGYSASGSADEDDYSESVVGRAGWARIAIATGAYALVTVVTGVALLVFAAAVLGAATGWLRERTTSLLAPIVAHLTWSLGMLYFLPSALDFWR